MVGVLRTVTLTPELTASPKLSFLLIALLKALRVPAVNRLNRLVFTNDLTGVASHFPKRVSFPAVRAELAIWCAALAVFANLKTEKAVLATPVATPKPTKVSGALKIRSLQNAHVSSATLSAISRPFSYKNSLS